MKSQNFTIVISFFCIWLTGYFSEQIQLLSAFLLIITFGILHGSNDIVLLNKINKKAASYSINRVLTSYVLVVLGTVLLFYFIPALALLVFVLISSYHFGEQHWNKKFDFKNVYIIKLYQFLYGFLILLLLFSCQTHEVKKVVFEISAVTLFDGAIYSTTALVLLLVLITSFYFYTIDANFKKNAIQEAFYLLLFVIIFKLTTLIWGFAIYFIFWHSIPSLIDQVYYLYGNWSFSTFLLYCKSAFWYWIISIAGIATLYFTLGEKDLFEGLFFSFLAAVTFPHVMVIITMNKVK